MEKSNVISGTEIAKGIKEALKQEVAALKEKNIAKVSNAPCLGFILVGNRPESALYVKMKKQAADEIGVENIGKNLPEDISQKELENEIKELYDNPKVNGILMQLPLPPHIDEAAVLDLIKPDKDVDGLHPKNLAYLAMRGREPRFIACTPNGCLHLIKTVCPNIEGKRAVVLGRSNIVGIPMALLLQNENATVTVCHSRTKDIPAVIREADILVAAIGKPEFVKGDWIKPGAIVIDVGINSIEDPTRKSGKRIVGDVEYSTASKVAGFITPVPGGVGPMTIAMLMKNTVESWKKFNF